jgi:eukaryotic-like serine/threonine-protein kinase
MAQKLLQYDVLERIGEGARSTIYAVRDPVSGREYAMKHVLRSDTKDIRFVEQMETEFEISKQFNHPNLRKVYDLKINKSLLMKVAEAYLLMELVDGRTIDINRPTDTVQLIEMFIQVAKGLKYMHQLGYVHCDLKPINILRTPTGQVKIIDFGQSCKIGTVKDRIQGTPDYIAPEQVMRQPVTQQTDVFNLGASMYWAVTGRHIPTLYTVNKKGENSFLLDARFDTPRDLNPNVPQALANLIMESVSTRASRRPADMDSVLQRLELAKHVLLKERGLVTGPTDALPDPEDSVHGVQGAK